MKKELLNKVLNNSTRFIELVFESADGLKLYCRKDGAFFAKNQQEFLSIVGCVLIDSKSSRKEDREIAKKFLNRLKNNSIYSYETGKPITVKW